MSHRWQLFARDRSLLRIGELHAYTRFQATLALNDAGKWALTMPGDIDEADLFTIDNGNGILVVADDQIVMSGPAQQTRYTDTPDGPMLEVEGIDDTAILAYRIAYPAAPWFIASEADTFTGTAEAALRHYVEYNTITGVTWPGRDIPYLVLGASANLGASGTWSARFDNLLQLLQEIAGPSGLRFQIRQNAAVIRTPPPGPTNGQLEFLVDVPRNQRDLVRFAPHLGNVRELVIEHMAPSMNMVVVGGEGKTTGRLYHGWHDGGSTAIFGVREAFIDYRQAENSDQLHAKALEELEKTGESWKFTVRPLDQSPTRYLDDWDLGDVCSVITRDHEQVQAYVAQVAIDLSPEGAVITPSLHTTMVGPATHWIGMARRLGHLERTAETWTVDQMADELASTFSPLGHAHAAYSPYEHDSFHEDAFAPIQHDNANHSTDMAPTPHNNTHHSETYVTADHDTAHDDRFSQLGHTHSYQAPILNGTYTGNGVTTGRQIALGVAVRFVIIYDVTSAVTMYVTIHVDGSLRLSDANEVQDSNEVHLHATDGFVVGDGGTRGNENNDVYVYVAIP